MTMIKRIAVRFEQLPAWAPRVVLTVLVFSFALWLYVTTAMPGMNVEGSIGGDSAELQRMANRLGIAHSTGYPIHTMVGYGAARLGDTLGQDPYTWITYTSALGSAIALALFFQLALELGNPPAAFAMTLAVTLSDIVWHMSTVTEVQGLQAIAVIGLLWLMVVHLRRPDQFWPLAGMAFFVGLGMANHRTIMLVLPPAGLAVLMTGAWRRLSIRQWTTLIGLIVLPLCSYGYIFWRARDPYVAIGVAPSWVWKQITLQDTIKHIRGDGLQGNFVFPLLDFVERLKYVWRGMIQQLTLVGVSAGLAGLVVLAVRNIRLGLVIGSYSIIHLLFLMGWRLDWKGEIYLYLLMLPLALGIVALSSWMLESPDRRPLRWWQSPAMLSVFSLPIFALALGLYITNQPNRDLRSVVAGQEYLAQLPTIPPLSTVFTGGWEPDTFVYLEYVDGADIHSLPKNELPEIVTTMVLRDEIVVYVPISQAYRQYGLYDNDWAVREGVAFSGTFTDFLVQIRPQLDPLLQAEADQAEVIRMAVAPGIELYSYQILPSPAGLRIGVYWRATKVITAHYSTYIHLRENSATGEILNLLAQQDWTAPVAGLYPTWSWPTGKIIKDTYNIGWPEQPLPSSGVTLTIGMFLSDTGERANELSIPLQGSNAFPIDFEALRVRVVDKQ